MKSIDWTKIKILMILFLVLYLIIRMIMFNIERNKPMKIEPDNKDEMFVKEGRNET